MAVGDSIGFTSSFFYSRTLSDSQAYVMAAPIVNPYVFGNEDWTQTRTPTSKSIYTWMYVPRHCSAAPNITARVYWLGSGAQALSVTFSHVLIGAMFVMGQSYDADGANARTYTTQGWTNNVNSSTVTVTIKSQIVYTYDIVFSNAAAGSISAGCHAIFRITNGTGYTGEVNYVGVEFFES